MPALDALTVEPSHSKAHEADGCGLLLICEHLDVGDAGSVIICHVDAVVANTHAAALLAVAGDAVNDSAKAGELFDVDMDQVSGMVPLVALDRGLGLEIPQPTQTKAVEHPGHGEEGCDQKPGDVAEVEALMTELHGVLQLLRIKRPTLGPANTASIR